MTIRLTLTSATPATSIKTIETIEVGSVARENPTRGTTNNSAGVTDSASTATNGRSTARRRAASIAANGMPTMSSHTCNDLRSRIAAACVMPTEHATMTNEIAKVSNVPVRVSASRSASSGFEAASGP